MESDPWWREPGRLTSRKVAEMIGEWVAKGRPEAMVPKASSSPYGTASSVTGAGWREMARVLREDGRLGQ